MDVRIIPLRKLDLPMLFIEPDQKTSDKPNEVDQLSCQVERAPPVK